jgi:DNA-binding NarL/FixJ family response regulator
MPVRILLVDDHKIFREGIRALLAKRPGIEIAGEAENGALAIQKSFELLPDVVLMDIAMPDMNGMEATRRIVGGTSDKVRVIGLSMHSEMRYVIEMIKAGAAGFLMKDCSVEELVQAIEMVKTGRIYLSPGVAENLIVDYLDVLRGEKSGSISLLSEREQEILHLIADGKKVKEIAEQLNLSPKTVEAHRQNIMEKLEIRSTAGLVKYAIREGLTAL